jgi:superfamily II DNA/RNA helicase
MRKRDEKSDYKQNSSQIKPSNSTANVQYGEDDHEGDFSNFPDISPKTLELLKKKNFVNLFPIQAQCFNPIYNRYDVIGRDLTGSGKTLAYSLPVVEFLRKNGTLGERKIQAIILAPTRELALQVTFDLLLAYSI